MTIIALLCSFRIFYASVSKHKCVIFSFSKNWTIYLWIHKKFPYDFFFFFLAVIFHVIEWMCFYFFIFQAPLKEHPGHFQSFALPPEEGRSRPALISDKEAHRGWGQSGHAESPLLASLPNIQLGLENLLAYFSCPGSRPHGWENLFELALFLKGQCNAVVKSLKPGYLVPVLILPTFSNYLKMGVIAVYTSQGFIRLQWVNICISDTSSVQHLSEGNWEGVTKTMMFLSLKFIL